MLEPAYDPARVEKESVDDNQQNTGKSFTILMPPPNVTGRLHVGHALNHTLQDILCRYQRQQGKDVLWQPGVDHAGIATQMVVERQLDNEGTKRKQLGREKFLERVWQWKEQSGGMIVDQLKRLGASADWNRQRFTMDEGCSAAVRKTFIDMYNDGLIYRGARLVNWDCALQTAISDLEVEQREVAGAYYHIQYALEDGSGHIEIATTRPETLLGDTAVAVNPDDERYQHLIGKRVIVPIVNRVVPVVADEYSDPEKGTGAVKITPAHDFNDFEVGQRHNLEQINILNRDGTLNDIAPQQLQGLDRLKARKKILELLGDALVETKPVQHTVPYGDRSGSVIEPFLTEQWFVDAEPLAKAGLEVVEAGYIKFVPENWTKTYNQWLENIQPWCISRQLWWGHRIPAWYDEEGSIYVAENEADAQQQAGNKMLRQDEDVLDTWFSSGLWPLSTLNWPKSFEQHRYPTQTLVTGFDIIFFWVARMIMMCLYVQAKERGIALTDTEKLKDLVPFRDVYVHALVRDQYGQKMSKSKGNVIDPIEMGDQFGIDALRMTLASQAGHGRDVRLSEDTVKGYRNFCTKLWNAARFGEMNECFEAESINNVSNSINIWILEKLVEAQKNINIAMQQYQFNLAVNTAYQFTWNIFCDWYIELIKPLLNKKDAETQATFQYVYFNILKMLHPVMPFVTRHLQSQLYNYSEPVFTMNSAPNVQQNIDSLIDLINNIRSIRSQVNVPAAAKLKAYTVNPSSQFQAVLNDQQEALLRMARLETITRVQQKPDTRCLQVVIPQGTLFLEVENIVDMDVEVQRLQKTLEKSIAEKTGIEKRLANYNFVAKAPDEVVAENRQRIKDLTTVIEKQQAFLKTL